MMNEGTAIAMYVQKVPVWIWVDFNEKMHVLKTLESIGISQIKVTKINVDNNDNVHTFISRRNVVLLLDILCNKNFDFFF